MGFHAVISSQFHFFQEARMKYSRLIAAAVFAASLVLSASAEKPAQCPMMHSEGGHEDLGLNADQKAKHDALHKEMQPIVMEHMKAMKDIRDKMKAEFLKPNPDQFALKGLSEQMQKAMADFSAKRIDHLLKLKAILTPQQFAKVIESKLSQCGCMGCCMEHEKGERGHEGAEKETGKCHHGNEGGEK
jgi:Spy/CpxP family protein refolding chaperone